MGVGITGRRMIERETRRAYRIVDVDIALTKWDHAPAFYLDPEDVGVEGFGTRELKIHPEGPRLLVSAQDLRTRFEMDVAHERARRAAGWIPERLKRAGRDEGLERAEVIEWPGVGQWGILLVPAEAATELREAIEDRSVPGVGCPGLGPRRGDPMFFFGAAIVIQDEEGERWQARW